MEAQVTDQSQQTDRNDLEEKPIISRAPDGRYVMTGTDVAAAWVVGQLAMRAAPDELKRAHRGLTDVQINLARALCVACEIAAADPSSEPAETDRERTREDDIRDIEIEAAWRAISSEVEQAPRQYKIEMLRSV